MEYQETIRSSINSILANKLRSGLTILGIVIGVTSVILLVALVSGLKSFITSQIEGLGSNLIFVIPGRIGGSRSPGGIQANKLVLGDSVNLKSKLAGKAEVSAVIQKTTTLKFGSKTDKGTIVFGVEAAYPKIVSVKLDKGRFFSTSEEISGKKVAVVGSNVVVALFGEGEALGKTIDVAGVRYLVVGVAFPRGGVFGIDQDNTIIIPLSTARRQFGVENLNTIYISSSSPETVKDIQREVTKILSKRLTEDDFSVMTQEQALSTVSQITSVLTLALGGIAGVSLLVGGIGIMNIMLVSVTERTREIGLRKAVGAKAKDIRNQFLIESIFLSATGGIVGIVLGITLSLILNRFITTTITLWSILLSFGFSMLVGIIFGVAPAIRASHLNPIEALRYE